MLLADTLKQKEETDKGNVSTSEDLDMTPLYVMISGVLVSIVANNKIKQHWDNALNMYNNDTNPSNLQPSSKTNFLDKLAMDISMAPDTGNSQWKITNTLSYTF